MTAAINELCRALAVFLRTIADALDPHPPEREHDWFHPYWGSRLQCVLCGMWDGADKGDPCPGPMEATR